MNEKFSEYIVYVDESGDHGLETIDPNYPVFVLAFCIFKKPDYTNIAVPSLQNFKFRHFGHDQIVLHERDIRKNTSDFSFFLGKKELKTSFLDELTTIVEITPFSIIAVVINKEAYRKRYHEATNPYHVALRYGLERIFYCLRKQQADNAITHVIVEQRGKVEDNELELEFYRVCQGDNYGKQKLPFNLIFADKKSNSTGLQLADLVARPIGLHILNPEQPNRAFAVIKGKLYQNENASSTGYGLKCFP